MSVVYDWPANEPEPREESREDGAQQRCPDCGGQGWWAKYPANGDPPEQIQCETCWAATQSQKSQ